MDTLIAASPSEKKMLDIYILGPQSPDPLFPICLLTKTLLSLSPSAERNQIKRRFQILFLRLHSVVCLDGEKRVAYHHIMEIGLEIPTLVTQNFSVLDSSCCKYAWSR